MSDDVCTNDDVWLCAGECSSQHGGPAMSDDVCTNDDVCR